MQTSIFEYMYPKYKITKPIRLIELFSGYSSQALALKYLNVPFEHWRTCEWAVKSIILTYSFPCQDLSLAGNRAGMSDTSTRSGMLWEVERILTECHELGNMPEVLLMENVTQVHGTDNVNDFNKWQLRLEQLGYKNYFQDLIATDYGIPQTRNRCFMVSILGNYNYTFPEPIPLKTKLSDLLEENVEEKWYVKEGTFKCFMKETSGNFPRKERFIQSLELTNVKDIAGTLKALQGNKPTDNHIIVPECTKKGYAEAYPGDGVYVQNIKGKRGMVQHQMIQTLKTSCDVGVVMKDLRIRNLTPKEMRRLMGVKDEDIDKFTISDSAKIHCFGDSIVVNVLMAIFKEMM